MFRKILAFILLVIWMIITLILGITIIPGLIVFTVSEYTVIPSKLLKIIAQNPNYLPHDANK